MVLFYLQAVGSAWVDRLLNDTRECKSFILKIKMREINIYTVCYIYSMT